MKTSTTNKLSKGISNAIAFVVTLSLVLMLGLLVMFTH